jgi:hypothetical protein
MHVSASQHRLHAACHTVQSSSVESSRVLPLGTSNSKLNRPPSRLDPKSCGLAKRCHLVIDPVESSSSHVRTMSVCPETLPTTPSGQRCHKNNLATELFARRNQSATMSSPVPSHDNDSARRPAASSRFPTAPSVMTMNGHFAAVGDAPTKAQYEHGIQVIDEEKEFKYAPLTPPRRVPLLIVTLQLRPQHLSPTDADGASRI